MNSLQDSEVWAPATTEFMDISFFSFVLNGQVQFVMLKRYVFMVDGGSHILCNQDNIM